MTTNEKKEMTMDITMNYLNEERVKLWSEINALKKALDETVAKLSQSDKATVSLLQNTGNFLASKIEEVRRIANEKTPEDVQTASRAAQEAVKIKAEIVAVQKEVEEYRSRLNTAKNALKRIQGISENSDVSRKEIEDNRAKIAETAKAIDAYRVQLGEKKSAVDEMVAKISGAVSSIADKSQEIAALKVQAGNASSEISATRRQLQELQLSLGSLKTEQETVLNESKETLDRLSNDNLDRFEKLYVESEKRITELEQHIEALLPGATSLSLSSAFENRRKAIEKNKWWWAMLLILSASAIVYFGWWSLKAITTAQQPLSAVPVRIIIVAGLVIIEEFARRNYNVSSRLAEAYAYKEAVAQSYVGFKKELADIDLPPRPEGETVKSVSMLADTFLKKIGDEPGKKVFDKERPALGVVSAISKMSGQDEVVPDKTQLVTTTTTFLSKVSWPIVVMLSVLAAAGCVVTWLLTRK
jgi:uncharacterized coiled-coil DUF342 family protein